MFEYDKKNAIAILKEIKEHIRNPSWSLGYHTIIIINNEEAVYTLDGIQNNWSSFCKDVLSDYITQTYITCDNEDMQLQECDTNMNYSNEDKIWFGYEQAED